VGHLEVSGVRFTLPDGRVLLDDVSFRVGDGSRTALVGANGAGKTTLLRLVTGELAPDAGAVTRVGSLGVMAQSVGKATPGTTVRDLLLSVAPPAARAAGLALDAAELAMMERDDEPTQLRYAQAIVDWGDAGGYDLEVVWDECTTAAFGEPFARTQHRDVATLSGGEQKRLVLEALLRGPDDVLLLDEPDNSLDVPGKEWLEERLRGTTKSVLLVSHDRELIDRTATAIASLELGPRGNTVWTFGGRFADFHQARADRFARLAELRRRWDEEHADLRALVVSLRQRAAVNDGMASRYQAAVTRLEKFEAAGPPLEVPREQRVTMRLRGGRTAKRAVMLEQLALTGLTDPFDLELWFGERLAVLGPNGTGKSHLLRLLAAGGSDPEPGNLPVDGQDVPAVAHTGRARLGARVVPGWFAQQHAHPELAGRTLLEVLHRGQGRRPGLPREQAAPALDRYELAGAAEQPYESLSGGQQARFRILLLELAGATLLVLDEPTDNLDLASADALQAALDQFEGTVVAVTHDRWFARSFDRFLVVDTDGAVRETPGPVWGTGVEPGAF
jgi:ATPase subunit of ABC transporter with duplicated ATPase domains